MIPGLTFADVQSQFPHVPTNDWRLTRILRDFRETFARPDVTPEILEKAWDLHGVAEVMSQ